MSEWTARPNNLTPYAHWFYEEDGKSLAQGQETLPLLFRPRQRKTSMAFMAAFDGAKASSNKDAADAYFGEPQRVPLPKGSRPGIADIQRPAVDDVQLVLDRVRKLPEDAVITGVIDSGIALGNARFRDVNAADGALQSRVLASWQQSGLWADGASSIDFGKELFQKDIEALFAEHQRDGWLDEDAFNRASGLSEPHRIHAQRDLEFGAAHGTHVMDLAAGMDAAHANAADLARRPIIAVNLPDRFSHGSAGNFLEYFAVYAIRRIVDLADLIWDEQHGADSDAKGFPIVINLSYGMQAGPKDASMIFETFCTEIINDRQKDGKPPLRIILPAGNDNLMRCHARALMGQAKKDEYQVETLDLAWRLQPADQTPNFIEVHATPSSDALSDAGQQTTMELTITPPGQKPVTLTGRPGHYTDPWRFGRIYCDAEMDPANPLRHRIRFVLCTLPTADLTDDTRTAPAGLWALSVKYVGSPIDVSLYIQSDQALIAGSLNAKRSYFEDGKYHRFDHRGALADTYSHPDGHHLDHWNTRGPIQRKGTLNAIASQSAAAAIGGFRLKDGAPAAYSSSTRAVRLLPETDSKTAGRNVISALFPSDDGALHQGLLASGVRSGSAAFIQGTSMSAALATRFTVEGFLQGTTLGLDDELAKAATDFEVGLAQGAGQTWGPLRDFTTLKTGAGRVPADMPRLVDRMGKG